MNIPVVIVNTGERIIEVRTSEDLDDKYAFILEREDYDADNS